MDDFVLRAEQITSHTDNATTLLQKLAHTPLTAFLLYKENKQLVMVLTTWHFPHSSAENFLREIEGIFNRGNTLCLVLQVLPYLLFWIYGSGS